MAEFSRSPLNRGVECTRLVNQLRFLTNASISSIIYLSKTSKHINRANQFKNTYNIGLDAKVHVGLFNRLHVAHKNNIKIEMIYNHITPKYTHAQTCEIFKKI